jgi:hypothetical protein
MLPPMDVKKSGIASDYSTKDDTRESGEHKMHVGGVWKLLPFFSAFFF